MLSIHQVENALATVVLDISSFVDVHICVRVHRNNDVSNVGLPMCVSFKGIATKMSNKIISKTYVDEILAIANAQVLHNGIFRNRVEQDEVRDTLTLCDKLIHDRD